jgi:hypothetical protein
MGMSEKELATFQKPKKESGKFTLMVNIQKSPITKLKYFIVVPVPMMLKKQLSNINVNRLPKDLTFNI